MKLSSSDIEKYRIFSYILGNRACQLKLKKIKKSTPRKCLILQEMEIKKKFSIFPETETLKKLFTFQGMEVSYISGN